MKVLEAKAVLGRGVLAKIQIEPNELVHTGDEVLVIAGDGRRTKTVISGVSMGAAYTHDTMGICLRGLGEDHIKGGCRILAIYRLPDGKTLIPGDNSEGDSA